MQMVDMAIAKSLFSDRKSRSVNIFFQRSDLGALVGLKASGPTYWRVWGAESPRKKGSYILHVSVESQNNCAEELLAKFKAPRGTYL